MANDHIEHNIDDVADSFGELGENAQELEGGGEVSLDELFNDGFMRKYTDFDSLEKFFDASPWTVDFEGDLEADLAAIPEDEFDEYVNQHTRFPDSEEMQGKAAEEWAAGQLGF